MTLPWTIRRAPLAVLASALLLGPGCISPPPGGECGHRLVLTVQFADPPPADGFRVLLEDGIREWGPRDCEDDPPWEGEPTCLGGQREDGESHFTYSYYDRWGVSPPDTFTVTITDLTGGTVLLQQTRSAEYADALLDPDDDHSPVCLRAEVLLTV